MFAAAYPDLTLAYLATKLVDALAFYSLQQALGVGIAVTGMGQERSPRPLHFYNSFRCNVAS